MKNVKVFAKAVFATVLCNLFAVSAMAEEVAVSTAAVGGGITDKGLLALAAGIAIGLAAFGGSLGQARAAASAFEGIARNPAAQGKIFIPMIIGLALIESLVIYALVVAFALNGKM